MKTALTIAGSDCSGGAGIQADIKTMTMNGVYAMSVITALTAQNTKGVSGIMEVSPDFLKMQIDAVFTDIFPDAVKIGMVSSPALIEVIAERLTFYKAKNIVVDPVMVATSGAKLITDDAIDVLIKKLMPLATVITPNIPEGEILSGMKITCREDMEKAAKLISEKISTSSGQTVSVLLKGGHSICDADDVLYSEGHISCYKGKRIDNPNTHGTGCTLSSAIASMLAIGVPLFDAVSEAKTYITEALEAGLDLGSGSGPLMHNYQLYEKAEE
ncbi:MAG: bifunctional hydroxymethylpyrimidine kinase/phosphomethylpyrimidine kinase [Clostridiales bacterium]|nr:bifunctional hydroxymethylpyrimidine kinase/phosphomethylpyrimidine kinase [Clostridiales bacterium]